MYQGRRIRQLASGRWRGTDSATSRRGTHRGSHCAPPGLCRHGGVHGGTGPHFGSVDTAVAHLSRGAWRVPRRTLLPFVPDWRWGLAREDTSWYPTMRLFRQPALGDWASVIQRVAEEVEPSSRRYKPRLAHHRRPATVVSSNRLQMMTVPQAFDLALQHHQAGRLAEAEALYRQILATQPDYSRGLALPRRACFSKRPP